MEVLDIWHTYTTDPKL